MCAGCGAYKGFDLELRSGSVLSADEIKEIDRLEDEITEKRKKLKSIDRRLDNKEDDLEETQEELQDIKDRLKNDQLTADERRALEQQRDNLQEHKAELLSDIAGLKSDKARIEQERDRAEEERDTARNKHKTAEAKLSYHRYFKDIICDRSPKVRDAISEELPQVDCTCASEITSACLESMIEYSSDHGSIDDDTIRNIFLPSIISLSLIAPSPKRSQVCTQNWLKLKEGDFDDLTGLESLDLTHNCLNNKVSLLKTLFGDLNSIKRINLSDTNILTLPRDFFNGLLDTLENAGVSVTDFSYCEDPEPPYKSKLGTDAHSSVAVCY